MQWEEGYKDCKGTQTVLEVAMHIGKCHFMKYMKYDHMFILVQILITYHLWMINK